MPKRNSPRGCPETRGCLFGMKALALFGPSERRETGACLFLFIINAGSYDYAENQFLLESRMPMKRGDDLAAILGPPPNKRGSKVCNNDDFRWEQTSRSGGENVEETGLRGFSRRSGTAMLGQGGNAVRKPLVMALYLGISANTPQPKYSRV